MLFNSYVKCVREKKGCTARGTFINHVYTQTSKKGHNHLGNENLPVKDRMLDNLKKFSSVPFLTPSQIYESAVSNDTTAAELYPYTKQRSTIKYLRSKSQPNLVHLPKHDRTLHGFWRSLVAGKLDGQLKYGDKKEFELTIHLENVTTKKNETATNLFIYDHDLLESVSRDHIDIHVDATFRCPPHFIDSSVQLLTVMIKIKNVSTHCDKVF
ncbi:hypothetical protein G9C98_001508 [Cotesia typhae]|uniref:Uncharacterized protein n=1 Tax=Cotesia typhae TaxID=2053667 RepID=A0A8J5UW09_9HYME|nr:hypothetical protein G9C98_001508 [Cotesia typhae]